MIDTPFDPDDNADLLGDTEPMPGPAHKATGFEDDLAIDALARLGLRTVGDAGWLDPDNVAPAVRALLTVPNELGSREVAFMPAGKVAMLVAPGGTGKSQALVQLAVSVASGKPWLGTYNVKDPGPVLLALGEEDANEMHRRIRGAVDVVGWDAAPAVARNLHALSLCGERAMLVDDEGKDTLFGKSLSAGLAAWPGVDGWRLIILDPASRFLGPEAETDNAQATRFIEAVERLTRLPGQPTVLFAHHTNKSALAGDTDQGAARGSSGLTDGARWQANLNRCLEETTPEEAKKGKKGKLIPNEVILQVVKANHCPVAEPLRLKRDLERGGFLAPMDPTTVAARITAAAKAPAEPKVVRDAREALVKAKAGEAAKDQAVTRCEAAIAEHDALPAESKTAAARMALLDKLDKAKAARSKARDALRESKDKLDEALRLTAESNTKANSYNLSPIRGR